MDFDNLLPAEVSKIHQVEFPENQYYKEEQEKNQIVLHHTVSGSNLDGILSTWKGDTQRVATPIIIGRDGVIHQIFSSKFWAHHLGIKLETFKQMGLPNDRDRNLELNKKSIGIELINWGGLTKTGDTITTGYGNKVKTEISEYPESYKGFKYFESYSEAQLSALGSLLLYFNIKYSIPLNYNAEMFQPSLNALKGEAGIWTHTSYRNDKSDCHPDPNLIKMLQSLTK